MKFIEAIQESNNFFGGDGVALEEITKAETDLQVHFSNEYKSYLLNFGIAAVDGHEFTGISSTKRLHVVAVTHEERKNNPSVPLDLYVVEQANIDGIVIWQSETGNIYHSSPYYTPRKICNSLLEYLNL